jgi:hypothetical protein
VKAPPPREWSGSMVRKPTVKPFPCTKPQFIEAAMLGRMGPEDQAYMARAILALSDENAAMKEQIRALEMAVRELTAAMKRPA